MTDRVRYILLDDVQSCKEDQLGVVVLANPFNVRS